MVGNGVTIKTEKTSSQTSDLYICFARNKTIISVREEDGGIRKTVINKTRLTKIRYWVVFYGGFSTMYWS